MPRPSTALGRRTDNCLRLYGTPQDFVRTFAPDNLQRYAAAPTRCVCGTAPELSTLAVAYGTPFPIQWLMTLFIGVSEFSGAKEKATPYQIEKLARKFYQRYPWLKATEVMLFIDMLEAGDFGRFAWATFDPVEVLAKVPLFLERCAEIERKERQRLDDLQAEQDRRQAVPCPPDIAKRLSQLFRSPTRDQPKYKPP